MQKFIDTLIALWNPLSVVSSSHQRQVRSDEIKISTTLFLYVSIFWAVAYLAFAYLTDTKKHNFNDWEQYRLLFAGVLVANVFLVKIVFRKWEIFLRIACIANALATSYLVSHSMTFGQKIRAEWIFFFPLIFLVIGIRNYFVASVSLITFVYLWRDEWSTQHADQVMITTAALSILLIGLSQILTKFWAGYRNLELTYRETVSKSIEEKIEFQRQIKRYIPSPLILKIEEEVARGKTLAAALDDIERIKVQKLAILYSDLINYSAISDSEQQVRLKLLAPVRKFVDRISGNGGIARTIGDGLFCFYEKADPEAALLIAISDACYCAIEEVNMREAGKPVTRYFTVGYGNCLVGKIGGSQQVEISIHGTPANETNRIDRISHSSEFIEAYGHRSVILMSKDAGKTLASLSDRLKVVSLGLNVQVKGVNSNNVLIFEMTPENIEALNELFFVNGLERQKIRENSQWLKESHQDLKAV